MSNRAQLARDFFIELGYKPWQAAGIVGNLMQESGPGLDTGAVGDKGTAFGIAQWRGKRKKALDKFAADNEANPNDFETQLRFVDYELKNHETGAYEALQASTDVPSATAAMIGYERPRGWTPKNPSGGHGWDARLENALALAGPTPAQKGSGRGTRALGNQALGVSATLNDVMSSGKGGGASGSGQVAMRPPSKGQNLAGAAVASLADMDWAGLFKPPEFPPLPELPPIPDPVPLQSQEPLYQPVAFQPRRPWSKLPGSGLRRPRSA